MKPSSRCGSETAIISVSAPRKAILTRLCFLQRGRQALARPGTACPPQRVRSLGESRRGDNLRETARLTLAV